MAGLQKSGRDHQAGGYKRHAIANAMRPSRDYHATHGSRATVASQLLVPLRGINGIQDDGGAAADHVNVCIDVTEQPEREFTLRHIFSHAGLPPRVKNVLSYTRTEDVIV